MNAVGEACDDANTVDEDACRNNCQVNVCGDTVRNLDMASATFEECDDGLGVNGNGTSTCTSTCSLNECGDGYELLATEACDDGAANGNGITNCTATCALNVCGDNYQFVGPDAQMPIEPCDDGNTVNTDACVTVAGECKLAVCGDTFIAAGVEECDPGTTPTASCDAMCLRLPRRFTEVEVNNVKDMANVVPAALTLIEGAITPVGDSDFYALTVPSVATSYSVSLIVSTDAEGLVCTSTDTKIFLLDSAGAVLASDDDDGRGFCSFITPARVLEPDSTTSFVGPDSGAAGLTPGSTVFVQVRHYFDPNGTSAIAQYHLRYTWVPAACGNNIVDPGEACDGSPGCSATCTPVCGDAILTTPETCESATPVATGGMLPPGCNMSCQTVCGDGTRLGTEQCDDGNLMANDGCSATCQFEFTAEVEPNGTTAEADANPAYPVGSFGGVTGAVAPDTELDLFRVVVPEGGRVGAEVTTAGIPDTCPTGADSQLRLLRADGSVVGSDLDDGAGNCSKINPLTDAFARNLPAGTYYVEVSAEEFFGTRDGLPTYTLLLRVSGPVCGNTVREGTEQCDDGDLDSGDGCSATCTLELSLTPETEDNNNRVAADPLNAGANDGWLSTINRNAAGVVTAGDEDYYTFTVPAGVTRSLVAEVSDGLVGCPFDSTLELRSAGGGVLATDLNEGIGDCSKLDGVSLASVRNLAPGQYFLVVRHASSTSTINVPYVLRLQLIAPACGNRVPEPGEACDDGNTMDNDGCSALCQIERDLTPEVEPNDDPLGATALNTMTGADGWAAVVNRNDAMAVSAGNQDFFSFVIPAGSPLSVRAEVSDGASACPFDSFMELRDSMNVLLASADGGGIGACSVIDPRTAPGARSLAAGTYYLMVRHASGTSTVSVPYAALLTFIAPMCGNGIPEPGEACDDGNMTTGDGCEMACTLSPGFAFETEPNSAPISTGTGTTGNNFSSTVFNGPFTSTVSVLGSLSPAGDEDVFALSAPATGAATFTLEVRLPNGMPCTSTLADDTFLHIRNAAGTSLASVDDSGGTSGWCSRLTFVAAAGTTVYAHLLKNGDSSVMAGYRLNITLVSVCGDGMVSGTETCDPPGSPTCDSVCRLRDYNDETIVSACATLTTMNNLGTTPADDVTSMRQALPFTMSYFDVPVTHYVVSSNGFLSLGSSTVSLGSSSPGNGTIPATGTPNGVVAPFWDDLDVVGTTSTWQSETLMLGGISTHVVEWKGWVPYAPVALTGDITFQVWLRQSGEIQFHYCSLTSSDTNGRARGNSATVGIESGTGLKGIQRSRDTANSVDPAVGIRFTPID